MGIFFMHFNVSKPLKIGSFELKEGDTIEVYPRKDELLRVRKDGRDFIAKPFILKYLSDIEFPSLIKLSEWAESSSLMCESPTGHLVPVDGTGPDGFHSWFRYLGCI